MVSLRGIPGGPGRTACLVRVLAGLDSAESGNPRWFRLVATDSENGRSMNLQVLVIGDDVDE